MLVPLPEDAPVALVEEVTQLNVVPGTAFGFDSAILVTLLLQMVKEDGVANTSGVLLN